MARTTKPLTNTEVQQAKPKEKEFNLVDGDGLALRVKPNGSKLWILNYYRPSILYIALMCPHQPSGLFINTQLYYQKIRADAGSCVLIHP